MSRYSTMTREELAFELERLEREGYISGGKTAADRALSDAVLLSKVLEILPVGVWITDREGKIIHGNPAGQQIWAGARYVGIEEYGEYKGWWAATGEPVAPDDWAVARAIRNGEVSINEEIEIECFDRTRKVILNSAMPIKDKEGDIQGAIVVNQDITARKHTEEQMRSLIYELQEAFKEVKVLSGLLPICASCKKIRDDKGYWNQIEIYIKEHSDAEFTHSICPDCIKRLYPEYFQGEAVKTDPE